MSALAGRSARCLAAGLLLGCSSFSGLGPYGKAGSDDEAVYYGYYRPDRRDYASFRQAHPGLLEPNYLPYMLHRLSGDEVRGDDLVYCRWPDEKMPLAVAIEPPTIPGSLQNEFDPRQPSEYVDAVAGALDSWEDALEGLVRFRRIEQGERADLHLRVLGQKAPTPSPEVQVLGATEGLRGSCLARGWERDSDRMRVRFEVSELVLYIADRYGLLTPDQVRRAAMHEVGHALGMSGHSPLSTDLMYPHPGRGSAGRGPLGPGRELLPLPLPPSERRPLRPHFASKSLLRRRCRLCTAQRRASARRCALTWTPASVSPSPHPSGWIRV